MGGRDVGTGKTVCRGWDRIVRRGVGWQGAGDVEGEWVMTMYK